jgi:hypothetical protein
MGTNFYWKGDVCSHCGRGEPAKHIGKSSAGWCFSLHVYPDEGIKDLSDWDDLLSRPASKIEDEYGRTVTRQEMLETIKEREGKREGRAPLDYRSWDDFYEKNHAVAGPKGLSRHKVDHKYCIGHGEGTWDLLIGEFS